MRVALLVSQFCLALCWVVYVVYLPELLDRAGIARRWLLIILIVDQLLFVLADVACGYWLDKVEVLGTRIGKWVSGAVIVSCGLFVALPLLASQASPTVLLVVLFAWVALSSAARVPPIVLLAKRTTPETMSGAIAFYLMGVGVAAASAPYLAIAMKGVSPILPFALASAALAVAILVVAASTADAPAAASATAPHPASRVQPVPWALLLAAGAAALAVQIHTAINSAALYKSALPGVALHWLMPIFWVGFSLAMFPASLWLQRASRRTVAIGTLVGGACGLALVGTVQGAFPVVLGQAIAGAAWGGLLLLLMDFAQGAGRTGHEGRVLGATLAMLALAAATRIALTLATSQGVVNVNTQWLIWLPAVCWLIAAAATVPLVMTRRALAAGSR